VRRLTYLCLGIVLFPSVLYAGQVFGSVISNGMGVANTAIEINCGGTATTGATAGDGSYRINVAQQGECTFTLAGHPGHPSAVVFSYPEPSQYDFEVVATNGGSQLRRR